MFDPRGVDTKTLITIKKALQRDALFEEACGRSAAELGADIKRINRELRERTARRWNRMPPHIKGPSPTPQVAGFRGLLILFASVWGVKVRYRTDDAVPRPKLCGACAGAGVFADAAQRRISLPQDPPDSWDRGCRACEESGRVGPRVGRVAARRTERVAFKVARRLQ